MLHRGDLLVHKARTNRQQASRRSGHAPPPPGEEFDLHRNSEREGVDGYRTELRTVDVSHASDRELEMGTKLFLPDGNPSG